ncbi:MAG: YrrS family protein [Carnobacterium alterfunditum]
MKNSKDNKKSTRSNKYDKERKTVKILTFAVVIAALIVIILLIISLFSGGDKPQESTTDNSSMIIKNSDDSTQSDVQSSNNSSESSSESVESESVESESKESESKESEKAESTEKKEVEPTDGNVEEVYTEDWEPVETEQEGEHKTNFNDGSQDRIEIKKAAAVATGLSEANMIEWWVENSGEGQVVATVSDKDQTKTYRVYLNWVDGQGWQPTKVEQLEENDKQ